jgi:hypothetical protein
MVLGSGILKKPIPDPGSRGQKAPDTGFRIRIRNTGNNKGPGSGINIPDPRLRLAQHI